MSASQRLLVFALACLSNFPSFAAAQPPDQAIAERLLGPQWKQLSRQAGMIFAGTVLTTSPQTAAADRAAPEATPAVQLSFRVERAITGVEPGQVLTIHEWAGAWSRHRPISAGDRILIFLYPPSRLGLTSPVGGSLGLIALDPSGKNVAAPGTAAAVGLRSASSPRIRPTAGSGSVTVVQLERAIRGARSEEE